MILYFLLLIGQGRSEPIPIQLKTGRSGVGHETENNRKHASQVSAYLKRQTHKKIVDQKLSMDYRKRLKVSHQNYQLEKDLSISQRICEQLDSEQVIFFFTKSTFSQR